MKAKTINEHALDNYSKFKNYLIPIKEKLINSLRSRASHLVEDKGNDIISIATGDRYSILVKVLGHDTMNESLNETRFSALEIPFNREDIKDKSLDAKFYIEEIENNLVDVDLTSKGFKFEEAFDKLKKCLDDISKATENHVEKNNTNESLNINRGDEHTLKKFLIDEIGIKPYHIENNIFMHNGKSRKNELISMWLNSNSDAGRARFKKYIKNVIIPADKIFKYINIDEDLNNKMLYKENKNKPKSNKYPLFNYNYE